MVRRAGVVVAAGLACALLSIARAEDPAAAEPPSVPYERAVTAVVRAVREGDETALAACAAKDDPDPWRVAEELLARGEVEAAVRFAAAAPRTDTERLPAYVASRRDDPPALAPRRILWAADAALAKEDAAAARERLDDIPPDTAGVTGIRRTYLEGAALARLHRAEEGTTALLDAADRAEAIGWWAGTSLALRQAASRAQDRGDQRTARPVLERLLALERARGHAVGIARATTMLGMAHHGLGDLERAEALLVEAVEECEQLEDRRLLAVAVTSLGNVRRDRGQLAAAIPLLERGTQLCQELGNPSGVATGTGNLGYVYERMGDRVKALAFYEEAYGLFEAQGNQYGMAWMLTNQAGVRAKQGEVDEALSFYERALPLHDAVGNLDGRANVLTGRASLLVGRGAYAEAQAGYEEAGAIWRRLGSAVNAAGAIRMVGYMHFLRSEYDAARFRYEEALAVFEALSDERGIAQTLCGLGSVHVMLVEYREAAACFDRALSLHERLGDREGTAVALEGLGAVAFYRGHFAKSLALRKRALALVEALGLPDHVAKLLNNVGLTHALLGQFPQAIACYERAVACKEALGNRGDVSRSLLNLGNVYQDFGDFEAAQRLYERALTLAEDAEDPALVAGPLLRLGELAWRQGAFETAVGRIERALEVFEEVENPGAVAAGIESLGVAYLGLGRYEAAVRCLEQARVLSEEAGNRQGVATATANLGFAYWRWGRRDEAASLLERALREARRLRAPLIQVPAGLHLANVRLEGGEAARALMTARQALEALEGAFGGLAEEEGAAARGKYADLFAVGALAAVRLEDPAEAITFLESGRAGSLLESLDNQRALRFVELPPDLLQAENEARAVEARARRAYDRALDAGGVRDIRLSDRVLDDALALRREVVARIQREAKKQAGLFYPRAATLEEIEGWLPDQTTLVLYGLCLDEALALVLTNEGERIVELGTVADVEAACAALGPLLGTSGARGPLSPEEPADPAADVDAALAQLRSLLVEPLVLGDDARTVLVSPEGALCYVPFGALFPERAVAVVPSGTTYVLLREEERERGEKVLALGDPDYGHVDRAAAEVYRGGGRLTALPATREEAHAVGDVVLLGAEATEENLNGALAKEDRWRAVHLACHGLVDPERPTLSSLALTQAGEEDGFLTALEVLRMEISADLAVLSACETGKGEIVKGEGVVGLTRAFMYAGSPRVLCSLWKVPDEATRALMSRFYELWNPQEGEGVPAAEALRRAQAFVRDHPEHPAWQHPRYWAAWVLWGLPR